MAQLYFRHGIHEQQALFDHFFRSYPNYGDHQAGYAINAGLEWLLDWMKEARFRDEEIALLRGMTGRDGKRIFADDFLAWLAEYGNFSSLTINAIPEGRVIHPNVPITTIQGSLAQAQLLETQLLNTLNYQTLIATKAARVHQAGRGGLLLEFGARRAQGPAALAGARAALIGGADFTSNAGISHVLGYPPKGTHAHSMVQVFMAMGGTELDAFRAYADVYPEDCLLLVDTIDTLESGIPNAIRVFEEIRKKGHEPVGIRLDSGDLAHLSVLASKMLDDAGFPKATIVLSNNLDELVMLQIITQIQEEAPYYDVDADTVIKRLTYGVGTRLITSSGDAALDGVYKLVAVHQDNQWKPAMKISESPEKILNPGHKRAYRIYDDRDRATVDLIALADEIITTDKDIKLHHPSRMTMNRTIRAEDTAMIEDLHIEVVKDGNITYQSPSIETMRQVRQHDISQLDPGVRRIVNPHIYHVSLSQKLWDLKQEVLDEMRQK